MQTFYTVKAIGKVSCSRTEAFDDNWDSEMSEISLDTAVLGPNAANGLEDYSHIEVIYIFDKVKDEKIVSDMRRPRGNPDWPKVGILAQRGRNRPNKIGATICQLVSVHGGTLVVKGLDAIDGTPVIDIKPVMSGFLPRTDVIEPSWAMEIMEEYWHSKT
jgi:tRNA-Thr(GGU) m(6)t(6)A37 methyltransferase TsaA